jgi:hypothetical protein
MLEHMQELEELQHQLAAAYSPDTATHGAIGPTPSFGHCSAVAAIVQNLYGGKLVTATVKGIPHVFNRIGHWDADLTSDQFGIHAPAFALADTLYPNSKELDAPLDKDTIRRARLLQSRLDGPRE